MTALITATLGVFIGLLMALTGAGGGVLAVPLLVFALGMPVHTAASISLLTMALAATVGALMAFQAGDLRYRAALFMGVIGTLVSPLGYWLAHQVNARWIQALFAAVLCWVSFRSLFLQGQTRGIDELPDAQVAPAPCELNPETGRFLWTLPCARALLAAASVTGLLSGLLGVGGGFVLVPALQRFTRLSLQSISGTALGVIALVSWWGAGVSWLHGTLEPSQALPFSLAAVTGMVLGRRLGQSVDPTIVRRLFGTLCAVVAMMMAVKAYSGG